MLQTDFSNALRAVASGLEMPVIIILLVLIAASVLLLGSLLGEFISSRRHMKQHMPQLVDALNECRSGAAETADVTVTKEDAASPESTDDAEMTEQRTSVSKKVAVVIFQGKLLKRHKRALLELTAHPGITPMMRESLAVRLLHEEHSHYERILKISDVIAKIAPMFGLLGTLIPLGPGIIALGQGDTYTLSTSLLTAFDTTVAGLISAAVAYLVSAIRRSWYGDYESALEMASECILEVMRSEDEADAEAEA